MKEQLQKIMEAEGLSPAKFADEIGVQRSSISHIISGRNKPSYDFIMKIIDRFKGINAEWLLTGKGSMIKGQDAANQTSLRAKDLFDSNMPKQQDVIINGQGSDKFETLNKNLSFDKASDEIKSEKRISSTKFTNVNNSKYILVFYQDGSFEQFNPRE